MEAREDSRQAEPRSERKGRVRGGGGEREGAGLWQSCITPQSRNYSFHKM